MQKVLDETKFYIVGLEEFTTEQLFFMVYGFVSDSFVSEINQFYTSELVWKC